MIYFYFLFILLLTNVQSQEQLEIVDEEGVVQKCDISDDCTRKYSLNNYI